MRILIAHNRYQQAGGEDAVVALEIEMLARRGHDVDLLTVDNHAIIDSKAQVLAALRSFYSRPSYKLTMDKIASFRPEVLHIHNILPGLSPSIYFAANAARIPVVQTLHNYRLVCANAQLFRDGKPCEECVQQRSFLPGVVHACYRASRAGSAVVGATMAGHALLGTWNTRIARYIALTQFASEQLGQSRIPAERIRVKPNFVPDHGVGTGDGDYALFVGRLSEEKGLSTLLQADAVHTLPMEVRIAGDGPLLASVRAAAARPGSRIVCLGRQSGAEVKRLMSAARVLLVPSIWYEGFPVVMVEALSFGLPIIASRIGGLPEIVEAGVCGLLHEPGDVRGLTGALQWVADHPAGLTSMREAARSRYLERYSEEKNYIELLAIYEEVLADSRASASST